MKNHRREFLLMFFALLVVYVNSEVEGSLKKRGDITQKSNSDDESNEEVGREMSNFSYTIF